MTRVFSVGLVGARGYVGREMIRLLAEDHAFRLTYATSREHVGHSVSSVFEAGPDDIVFSSPDPSAVVEAGCDVVVLGLPNGLAAPFVRALDRAAPDTVIVDLSADYRHVAGWVFGLSDLQQAQIIGARRIANPGCYATAAILALLPIASLINGIPSVVGLSGYSGAGTTPSAKNDTRRLAGNVMPYAFDGHGHQHEISQAIGRPVRFLPHVLSFFRGLMVTVTAPVCPAVTVAQINAHYREAYREAPTVRVQSPPPEITQVAGTPNAVIGGAAIDPVTNVLAVSCVHDNLLKGAASQAMANMRIALGLDG